MLNWLRANKSEVFVALELDVVALVQLAQHVDGAVGEVLELALADHVGQDQRRGVVALVGLEGILQLPLELDDAVGPDGHRLGLELFFLPELGELGLRAAALGAQLEQVGANALARCNMNIAL